MVYPVILILFKEWFKFNRLSKIVEEHSLPLRDSDIMEMKSVRIALIVASIFCVLIVGTSISYFCYAKTLLDAREHGFILVHDLYAVISEDSELLESVADERLPVLTPLHEDAKVGVITTASKLNLNRAVIDKRVAEGVNVREIAVSTDRFVRCAGMGSIRSYVSWLSACMILFLTFIIFESTSRYSTCYYSHYLGTIRDDVDEQVLDARELKQVGDDVKKELKKIEKTEVMSNITCIFGFVICLVVVSVYLCMVLEAPNYDVSSIVVQDNDIDDVRLSEILGSDKQLFYLSSEEAKDVQPWLEKLPERFHIYNVKW